MSVERGETLREAREARGVTLEQVSHATRIPVPMLQAIEHEQFERLPPGPYRIGQVRAYCAYLSLAPDPALIARLNPPAAAAPRPLPRWVGRAVAGALTVVLGAAVLWMLGPSGAGGEDTAVPAPVNAPDQRVQVVARRTTRLRIVVDGEVAVDRTVPGGEQVEVAGHRRVEVHLEGADAARVEYNGDLIVPQGRQDVPRRLVFIDDLEPQD